VLNLLSTGTTEKDSTKYEALTALGLDDASISIVFEKN
jgi:hypothetical protein